MKKFIVLASAVLSISWALVAGEPPVSPTLMPSASDPNEPNAIGPKRSRKEMKKEMREEMRKEREKMHSKMQESCGAELQTAGCAGKTGGDMMQCMRTYREAHPEFKLSEKCREVHSEKHKMMK